MKGVSSRCCFSRSQVVCTQHRLVEAPVADSEGQDHSRDKQLLKQSMD